MKGRRKQLEQLREGRRLARLLGWGLLWLALMWGGWALLVWGVERLKP